MPQINVCTIPAMLLLVLIVGLIGSYGGEQKSAPNKYKRVQSREDIRRCGYGQISYENDWCIQWGYRHAIR